jgi:hypothetical protein
MFMEDEEKDKEEGEVSEDAIGEMMDEDETEDEDTPKQEGDDDEYRERDWA